VNEIVSERLTRRKATDEGSVATDIHDGDACIGALRSVPLDVAVSAACAGNASVC
jgi:hypothetical protein